MDIRTFRAATLQEALEQVRETLGPDAAVLHTRQVKRSRLGLFSSSLIEVEASVEMPVSSRFAKGTRPSLRNSNKADVSDIKPEIQLQAEPSPSKQPNLGVGDEPQAISETPTDDPKLLESHSETSAPESHVVDRNQESVDKNPSRLPPAMYETLSEMLDAGIEADEAKSLLQSATRLLELDQLNDTLLLQGRICQLVSKSLRVAEPLAIRQGQQTVVALVGPTGVGKTTTLAKLATNFQQDSRCEVGLITMDTFRPGAVDQLLQYAESLNAALEVVSSADQFLPALQRLKDCDVVLIDTAGRSPNDTEQIRVLQRLLESANPTSVQLVVSATSALGHVQSVLDQFSPLNPTGLVITKLDEATGFGAWLPLLQNCDLPLSYLTHGQHVPRDFSVANRRRLASLLLGHAGHAVAGT